MKNAIILIESHKVNIVALQQRRDKFKEYWNQYNDVQIRIYKLLDEAKENMEALRAEQDENAANFEENYFEIAGKLERLPAGCIVAYKFAWSSSSTF